MSATLARRQLVEPDYWTCPHGIRVRPSLTYGPAVAELCDKAGYTPDPQQELGLDLVFAIRSDGSPETFAFCVICARQNLKSGLFLQCVVGWLFVTETPEIAWSAHELRTSLNAQTELYRILESPALSKYLPATGNKGLYDTNGKERIELNTDQIVWFQTRTRDGGRGLGKPKVILDEAFKLKRRMVGALLPILLAQHHPQLAYGSSAPPLDDDADQLRDVMDRGRNHKSPELSYLEWLAPREPCADPECTHPKDAVDLGIDCALDREHLLRKANPTLTTGRITLRTLRNLRQELPPEEFMRECLGWEERIEDVTVSIFGRGRWEACAQELTERPEMPPAIGVAVSPDLEWASIAAATPVEVLEDPDDAEAEPVARTYVAPVDRREGVEWLVAEVKRIQDKTDCVVIIDSGGPAKDLVPDFEDADVALELIDLDEYAQACSKFYRWARNTHLIHPLVRDEDGAQVATELDEAVGNVSWRDVGDGRRVWGRKKSVGDISMLEAATLAAYAADKFGAFNIY